MDPEHLLERARREAGADLSLPAPLREGLEVLCASLRDEARLHPYAERGLAELVISGLVARHRLDAAALPERPPGPPPVIVCGLPRTGTTLLQHLLAHACGLHSPSLAELYDPVPDPRRPGEAAGRALGWLRRARLPLSGLHAVSAEAPAECSLLLRLDLRSQLAWACAPVPAYLDWLEGQDLSATYRVYARALAAVVAHQPRARAGLVLKHPGHAAALPALRAALPEARVVVCHRDPDEAVPSSHALVEAVHAAVSPGRDAARSRGANLQRLRRQAEATAAHADLAQVHVAHARLVTDPAGVLARISSVLGLPAPDPARIAAWTLAHPRPPRTAPTAPMSGFEAYRSRFAPLLRPQALHNDHSA